MAQRPAPARGLWRGRARTDCIVFDVCETWSWAAPAAGCWFPACERRCFHKIWTSQEGLLRTVNYLSILFSFLFVCFLFLSVCFPSVLFSFYFVKYCIEGPCGCRPDIIVMVDWAFKNQFPTFLPSFLLSFHAGLGAQTRDTTLAVVSLLRPDAVDWVAPQSHRLLCISSTSMFETFTPKTRSLMASVDRPAFLICKWRSAEFVWQAQTSPFERQRWSVFEWQALVGVGMESVGQCLDGKRWSVFEWKALVSVWMASFGRPLLACCYQFWSGWSACWCWLAAE